MENLKIGSIIHTVLISRKHRPGIVMAVNDESGGIDAWIFSGKSDSAQPMVWVAGLIYNENHKVNTWHYPEE